jgi:hypothetical protein
MYVTFSIIAAALIIFLAVQSPSTDPFSQTNRLIVAAAFIMCAVLGTSFAIRPNWIRRFGLKKNELKGSKTSSVQRMFQGHHPDCKAFESHTIKNYKTVWCAGCLGLGIGCTLSIVFMAIYVFFLFHQSLFFYQGMIVAGLFIITMAFLDARGEIKHPIRHIVINSALPLSFVLITISIVELTSNLMLGLCTILLCFLWLDTRVQLSAWRHQKLCYSCPEPCKMY